MTTPTTLTVAEELALRARAEGLSNIEAGAKLGISSQTVKNQLTSSYRKLGVDGLVDALRTLGWVSIPGEPDYLQCSFVGRCGRRDLHRGQHGGFRPVLS